jgi:mannose/fructose/N-acetylgalactosamine-specific phosphotransferase system component IIC
VFLKFLFAGVVSAFTYIDATAAGQFMISRPIVAAPIMGIILGDLQRGILVGVLLELLWVGTLPVGATVPPESTFAAVNTVAIAVLTNSIDKGSLVLIFIYLIPFIYLASFFEDKIREKNNKLTLWAERAINAGNINQIEKLHITGLLMFFVKTFVISTLAITSGYYLVPKIQQLLPDIVLDTFEIGGKILPILGVAVVIDLLINKKNWYFFILGLVLGLLKLNLWLLTITALVIALYLLLVRRSGNG